MLQPHRAGLSFSLAMVMALLLLEADEGVELHAALADVVAGWD